MTIEQEPTPKPSESTLAVVRVPKWVIEQLDPTYDSKQFQITSWAADIYDRNSG